MKLTIQTIKNGWMVETDEDEDSLIAFAFNENNDNDLETFAQMLRWLAEWHLMIGYEDRYLEISIKKRKKKNAKNQRRNKQDLA